LEGLEISEILKSEIENQFTIGAEFYKKDFVEKIHKMLTSGFKIFNLKELSKIITDGDHGAPNYQSSGVLYLLSESIKEGFIDTSICRYITTKLHKDLKRSALKSNDVVVTKTGIYFGKSAVIPEDFPEANTSAHVGKITPRKELINSYYLSSFINSKYGYFQLRRRGIKATRPEIKLVEFDDIKICVPTNKFQNKIENVVKTANNRLNFSCGVYNQAENLLLETLGLENFEPSKEPVNIKNLKESFLISGRLDAEYYQKKYDVIEKRIKKFGKFEKIKDIRTVNYRGLQPVYVADGELDVINSKHILDTTLDYGNFEKTNHENWKLQERARVFKGDILTYTTGANIGRTQVYLLDKKALASNHVNILRLKKSFNSSYIAFAMNSLIGRLQTEKFSAGSAQAELYPKDIDEFIIPLIDETDQLEIRNLIEKSFNLKEQSEQLLELAKTAVEKAIEENEDAAMEFINLELEKLSITG
jgi:restriction endonuclease S subunit